MPRTWYDIHAVAQIEDEDQKKFYKSILADKKPYFMRYIYPTLMKEYKKYVSNTDSNSLRKFGMTVDELKQVPADELTEEQQWFIRSYDYHMPVGTGDCVMNKICRRFEQEFDGHVKKHNAKTNFDYRIMKSDAEYTPAQFSAIKSLYEEYNKTIRSYTIYAQYERVDKYDSSAELSSMYEQFREDCYKVCSNRFALCNIVLDLCYTRNSTKRFAWMMCGDEIIHNLLQRNGNIISFPVMADDGDFTYCGNRFKVVEKRLEVDDWWK